MDLVENNVSAEPASVLDIGCGTGQLLASLGRRYPQTQLCGLDLAFNMTRRTADQLGSSVMLVNGDAEYLPFSAGVFDLVVSTSTLQWIENLDVFFQQCHRVIRPGGLMCIAFFGGRTLHELQHCYREAVVGRGGNSDGYLDRMHRFKEVSDVQDALGRSAFGSVLLSSEIEMDYYHDVADLLRSIKRIGAGSASMEGNRGGLGWRNVINETSRLYQELYGADGMIPATYEVLYIVLKGVAEG